MLSQGTILRRSSKEMIILVLLFGAILGGTKQAASEAPQVVKTEVDGIALQMTFRPSTGKGKYLVALNALKHLKENEPPFTALVMTISTDGKIQVIRKYISLVDVIWAIDFKPQPDGLFTFALNRVKGPRWKYDMKVVDLRDNSEHFNGVFPADESLDGHETIIYRGDLRYFLYYRPRSENGKQYLDNEIKVFSKSGEKLAEWSSAGLFPATETGDYLHINSLFAVSDDLVLASARSTSSLYLINVKSGKIEEEINSKTWRFENDPMNGFLRQHAARIGSNGTLLLYDNRDEKEDSPHSRAVEYQIDWRSKTLKLIWQALADQKMPFRYGWGATQEVGSDEMIISWGDYPRSTRYCDNKSGVFPVFSHMKRDKSQLFELSAPCGWATYRTYFVPEK